MRTVSKEMAVKLKEAGLKWEPLKGDQCLLYLPHEKRYLEKPIILTENGGCLAPKDVWLPTLSELLQWLEMRGYSWDLYDNYPCTGYIIRLEPIKTGEFARKFVANTKEDAAAKAVLWVLKQERESKNGGC